MANQGSEHFANTLNVVKGILELLLRYIAKVKGYVQLRTNLACRTSGYVKELHELAI